MSTLGSVVLRDVIANRPTASIPGRTFYATDTGNAYRDNGTSWDILTIAASVPTGAQNLVYATPNGSSGAATLRPLVAADLPTGSGTVTSVAMTVPSRQSVAGSPVTSSGTLAITDNNQAANLVFAGPSTGSAAAPTFRTIVAADAPTLATQIGFQQDAYAYATDTGAANAYAVALTPTPTIIAGSSVTFKAANANTGASTIAVNGGTATSIKKNSATALASGDIAAGQIVSLTYDGTSWQIPASSPNNSGTVSIPLTIGFVMNTGATGTNVGPILVAPRAGSINSFVIVTKTSDVSTALALDITQNGTSVFTATKPSLVAGTASGTVTTFTTLTSVPLAVAKGDVFRINITSGTASWAFTCQLET